MNSGVDRKKVLVVSLKREAEPVLGQLRAAGHQVSLVESIDEAQTLLASGGFDQTLLLARTLEQLLEQRALWQRADTDAWRKSTAGIAHDLRSLLSALEWSIRELDEADAAGTIPGDDIPQLSRTIAVLSSFLLELTGELESATDQGTTFAMVNLEDVVESAAMTVYPSALERRQRLAVDVAEDVALIRADPAKIKRVMVNLLAHASRQCPSQGAVTVQAYREAGSCIITLAYAGDSLSLSELRRLFSPASAMTNFSDAGLSRVQRLIEQQGGRVWVESQHGDGTRIFVSLPQPDQTQNGDAMLLTRGHP